MSESLRIELKPLGVKVLHVTTGFISTVWFSNVPEFELPEGSYYEPVKEKLAASAQGKTDFKKTPVHVYADKVVKEMLAGREGRIWKGNVSTLMRWALALIPRPLVVSCLHLFV
jgi:short-subunit dehydrogenase